MDKSEFFAFAFWTMAFFIFSPFSSHFSQIFIWKSADWCLFSRTVRYIFFTHRNLLFLFGRNCLYITCGSTSRKLVSSVLQTFFHDIIEGIASFFSSLKSELVVNRRPWPYWWRSRQTMTLGSCSLNLWDYWLYFWQKSSETSAKYSWLACLRNLSFFNFILIYCTV